MVMSRYDAEPLSARKPAKRSTVRVGGGRDAGGRFARFGLSPRHRRPSVVAQFLASVLPQPPVDSSRPPRGASPGGSTGRARGLDGTHDPFLLSGSRRVSTLTGRAS